MFIQWWPSFNVLLCCNLLPDISTFNYEFLQLNIVFKYWSFIWARRDGNLCCVHAHPKFTTVIRSSSCCKNSPSVLFWRCGVVECFLCFCFSKSYGKKKKKKSVTILLWYNFIICCEIYQFLWDISYTLLFVSQVAKSKFSIKTKTESGLGVRWGGSSISCVRWFQLLVLILNW